MTCSDFVNALKMLICSEKHPVSRANYGYTQGRIYYEANEASASGPHHLGGPHQNFNVVSKVNFFIA